MTSPESLPLTTGRSAADRVPGRSLRARGSDPGGAPVVEEWAEPLMAGILDALDCHLAVIDASGRIIHVNRAWDDFAAANGGLGVGVGANYFEVCETAGDPSAREVLERLREVAADHLDGFEFEYPCHSPDEQRWFRMTANRATGPGPQRIVIRHNAITSEKLERDKVQVGAQLLDAVDAAVVATDLDGVVQVWNHAAERLYGWRATDAVGQPVAVLTTPSEGTLPVDDILAEVLADGEWEGERHIAGRDGDPVPVHVRDRLILDDHGAPKGVVGVSVDLSERVAIERDLAHRNAWLRAITDRMGEGLCTLSSEGRIAYVNPEGERLLGAADGTAVGGSFVNRLLGMREDGTPRDVTEQLIGADFDGAVPGEVAEDRLLRTDGTVLPIEYVVTELPHDEAGQGSSWVAVFRDITERLEHEKQLQRDAEDVRWISRIQDALDEGRFVLHAQPLFDLDCGEVVQHELLIRLDDPDEGLLSPATFLPTAEAYGQILAIDRWVIGRAIELVAAGHAVEINLSARSFGDPSLRYLIEQLLHDSGAEPSRLVFELTETALLQNDEAASTFAEHMHRLGCQLALDDFGTGYGAFTYLKHLPVDLLKIDREFVRDAVSDPASRHVIEAVVSLARAFSLVTVAEGVEDQATLELLTSLGVDQAQGHHLARPAPLAGTRLGRPPGEPI